MTRMDKFADMYWETNYTRLFLLFILFLVSLYYYIGETAEQYAQAAYIEQTHWINDNAWEIYFRESTKKNEKN